LPPSVQQQQQQQHGQHMTSQLWVAATVDVAAPANAAAAVVTTAVAPTEAELTGLAGRADGEQCLTVMLTDEDIRWFDSMPPLAENEGEASV
jgi:hypothetical protein